MKAKLEKIQKLKTQESAPAEQAAVEGVRVDKIKCAHGAKLEGQDACSACITHALRVAWYPNENKKENTMKAKIVKEAKSAVTKEKRITVMEAWGQGFVKYGTAGMAAKLIVEHMEKTFPDKDTNWAKWVNLIRARYNSGHLPGAVAPLVKLPPFVEGKKSAKSAKAPAKKTKKAA